MQDRQIYYDLGAYATALAIHRAGNHTGRGIAAVADYWTSAERGFWRRTDLPWGDINHKNGWPSDVPEGEGWRRGLAEFMGDADTTTFYAIVEAAIVKDGVVATKAELLATISDTFSDAAVEAAAQVAADTSTCEFSTGALTACNEGLACGEGGESDDGDDGSDNSGDDVSASSTRRPRLAAALLLSAAVARWRA